MTLRLLLVILATLSSSINPDFGPSDGLLIDLTNKKKILLLMKTLVTFMTVVIIKDIKENG